MSYYKLAEEFFEFMHNVQEGGIGSAPPPPHPMDLTRGEMGILIHLCRNNHEGVSAGDLSKVLNLTTGRIASALKTLEKKDFIVRKADASDGRKVVVYLTENGNEFIQKKKQEMMDHFVKHLEKFSLEEAKTFIEYTKRFFTG